MMLLMMMLMIFFCFQKLATDLLLEQNTKEALAKVRMILTIHI